MTRSSAPLSDSHFGENWAYHKRLGIALISGGRRVRDLTTHPWLARQNPSIGFQKATSQGTLRLSSPACLGAKQDWKIDHVLGSPSIPRRERVEGDNARRGLAGWCSEGGLEWPWQSLAWFTPSTYQMQRLLHVCSQINMTDMAESIEAFGKLQNIYHGASGAAGRHLLLLHFSRGGKYTCSIAPVSGFAWITFQSQDTPSSRSAYY